MKHEHLKLFFAAMHPSENLQEFILNTTSNFSQPDNIEIFTAFIILLKSYNGLKNTG